MKQREYTKEEIVKKIKEKKELSGIADEIVKDALEKYMKKHKIQKKLNAQQTKTLVKEIRSELRILTGRFQKAGKDKNKFLESDSIKSLLKTHSSTAERLEFYPELKKIISQIKVKTILDLGCGLNPIALASPKMKYYASDIKEDELKLIETFFKKNKIKGKTFVYDIRKIKKDLPKSDLCLIFKVLDILEKEKKAKKILLEKIISNINCKYFLISFPTKKLSGKAMNFPKRTWFEKTLEKQNLKFETFSTENEIFYLVKKN